MKKVLSVFAFAAMLSGSAFAQDINFGGNQASDHAAKYSEKFLDINYAGDNQVYHNLDVYLPKGKAPKTGYPVVIHIYGSAWFNNNGKGQADINTICAAYLEAGYAVVCPNHRSSQDAKYPAQINDIKAAIRWVRGNAKKYNFDTRFVATSGFSSGGHLASLCATTNGVKVGKSGDVEMDIEGSLGKFLKMSSDVNACVDWSGPIDLMNMDCAGKRDMPFSPEAAVMGFESAGHEDAYRLLSPVHFINKNTVPVYVFHGLKDNVVPSCQGQELYDALVNGGAQNPKLHMEPEGGHGYLMYTSDNLSKAIDFINEAKDKAIK